MKCIKLTSGEIKRITNEKAEKLVKQEKAQYCSKSEWKNSQNFQKGKNKVQGD